MKLIIINGPNLNLLGIREKKIYVNNSFESYFKILKKKYSKIQLEYYQSNHEGELIEKIQETGFDYDGIIINAGGFTHTSIALRDAISSINLPAVEVHISNIFSREEFRKKSYLSDVCEGIISGLGLIGYDFAINYFDSK
jgi:3-dehydroquinate dehydratase-2